ncbi:MAG: AMIN domain-containing protein [Thiotrichales bacterium]
MERLIRSILGYKSLGAACLVLAMLTGALPTPGQADPSNTLLSIKPDRQSADRLRLVLEFSEAAPAPLSFSIANPARLALDFPNTRHTLNAATQEINLGVLQSVSAAQAKDRTRVVVNLSEMVPYQAETQGNKVFLTLSSAAGREAPPAASTTAAATPAEPAPTPAARGFRGVENIDFRRTPDGTGRIILKLTDPNIPIDVKQQGSRIVVDITGAPIPPSQQRRMDVTDFATPVQTVEATSRGNNSQIVVNTTGEFTQLAYQSDTLYTLEVKPHEVRQERASGDAPITFKGEKLSLNFQDIEVRSVLQLIADFTGLNVVVSDSVTGNLTLRLQNVPWDQALDIIMRTKGLDKRQQGNVLFIAPTQEIAEQEKAELLANRQVEDLAPLRSEIIPLNYADAQEMATLLRSGGAGGAMSAAANSILSKRGSVTIDRRTNNLLVQDIPAKIDEIRQLVRALDVPVQQVMIESRIVTASDQFSHELGVSFGGGNIDTNANRQLSSDFAINLPATNPAGSVGFALSKIPLGTNLDLHLSAAKLENRAEIIASPRIITANKSKARIEQGVQIPYEEATSSGATNIAFKKAVLSLEVTPHITRDDRINMELIVNRDSVGQIFNNVPSIDTREVQTQVLVDNGQTIVLGGIFEESIVKDSKSVPFLGDLPILGHLFRRDGRQNDKSELLIFVTPKIINDNMRLR